MNGLNRDYLISIVTLERAFKIRGKSFFTVGISNGLRSERDGSGVEKNGAKGHWIVSKNLAIRFREPVFARNTQRKIPDRGTRIRPTCRVTCFESFLHLLHGSRHDRTEEWTFFPIAYHATGQPD